MEGATDITSPTTQRRLWRRVWIGVALFVVLMPVVAWIVIDQAGKAEWRKVQAKLREKGVATSFAELDLPTRSEIPDEENFCAIPWLISVEYQTESTETREVSKALQFFTSNDKLDRKEFPYPRDGDANLGVKLNVSEWRAYLDAAAHAEGLPVAQVPQDIAHQNAMAVLAYLDRHKQVWDDLEDARDRPVAQLLPTLGDRLPTIEDPWRIGNSYRSSIILDLLRALQLRTASALQAGDFETAVRSVEIQFRLVEALTNQRSWISTIVANSITPMATKSALFCLWEPEVQTNRALLLRVQQALLRNNMVESFLKSEQFEMVVHTEGILWMEQNRAEAAEILTLRESAWEPWMAQIPPPGWFHGNAAYAADLRYRYRIESGGSERSFNTVQKSARQLHAELIALSRFQEFCRQPTSTWILDTATILDRVILPETRRRQAVIGCALYRYALDHDGKFPSKLIQLVPEYLDEVLSDLIDDEPMRYALESDGADDFELWSIGRDGIDDEGGLSFNPGEPLETDINRHYKGDWPWLKRPLEIPSQNP